MSFIKRRQYVVDKKLQFGTTFSVIAVSFLVVAVMIGLIGYTASRNNDSLSKVVEVQDNIVQALISHATANQAAPAAVAPKKEKNEAAPVKDKKAAKPDKAKAVKEKKTDQDISLPPDIPASTELGLTDLVRDHRSNIESMKKMVSINFWLFWIVTALVVLQGVVLFIVLILKTHRIAGPIYVMSNYMKQIIGGKIPPMLRPLRDKDALKDFYDLFANTITALKGGKKAAVAKPAAKKSVKKAGGRRK
jgi:hypothetical protein